MSGCEKCCGENQGKVRGLYRVVEEVGAVLYRTARDLSKKGLCALRHGVRIRQGDIQGIRYRRQTKEQGEASVAGTA